MWWCFFDFVALRCWSPPVWPAFCSASAGTALGEARSPGVVELSRAFGVALSGALGAALPPLRSFLASAAFAAARSAGGSSAIATTGAPIVPSTTRELMTARMHVCGAARVPPVSASRLRLFGLGDLRLDLRDLLLVELHAHLAERAPRFLRAEHVLREVDTNEAHTETLADSLGRGPDRTGAPARRF